jgi:hypothetical protein
VASTFVEPNEDNGWNILKSGKKARCICFDFTEIESLQKREAKVCFAIMSIDDALQKIEALQAQVHKLSEKLDAKKRENRQLQNRLQDVLRRLYGRSSEKTDPSQLRLGFEDLADGEDDKLHPYVDEAPDDGASASYCC